MSKQQAPFDLFWKWRNETTSMAIQMHACMLPYSRYEQLEALRKAGCQLVNLMFAEQSKEPRQYTEYRE